ncbi:MAG: nicotinate phosphoribosyltransferase [Thermoproteota archaeon]
MTGNLQAKPRIYVAEKSEILSGRITDVYFDRTRRVLEKAGLCGKRVRAELHAYSLPRGFEWAVFAGLEEALAILEGRRVNVYAMPEGTLFKPMEPIMVIEGPYCEFATLETAMLGAIRHETSIATKAARIKLAAGDKTVLFFGLRAVHPAIAPMADRAAYIGGVDGVSGLMSKDYIGVEPRGTMPHALVIIFGDPAKAWRAFDEYVEPDVPRIALVDTFYDERFEALLAAKTLGSKLYGVRLDTPSSRRGNMKRIVQEVRWTLKINGYSDVKIFVSGGLDEEEVAELRDLVDGFGVGTSIAFPPSVDVSMDIVEVEENGAWVPVSKRGKLPGFKQVYRCPPLDDTVVRWGEAPETKCSDGSDPKPLLELYLRDGKLVKDLPSVEKIRMYVIEQLKSLTKPG